MELKIKNKEKEEDNKIEHCELENKDIWNIIINGIKEDLNKIFTFNIK